MSDFRHIVGTADLFERDGKTYVGHTCETCDGLGEVFDRKNPGPNGAWPRVHCRDCDNYGFTFELCGREYVS